MLDFQKMTKDEIVRNKQNLRGADLSGMYLQEINLSNANLQGANLQEAYLRKVNLRGAILCGANLSWANLQNANLSFAHLQQANLKGADLTEAKLDNAFLQGATIDLEQIMHTRVAPIEGPFWAWKACRYGVLVKLLIPAEARRSNSTTRKCRAEFADVLEVHGAGYSIRGLDYGISWHSRGFIYEVGKRVTSLNFDPDWRVECGGGIHFFMTRQEAQQFSITIAGSY